MFVLDTSVWVEWIRTTPLAPQFAPFFHKLSDCIVPVTVQYELQKWALREGGRDDAAAIIALTQEAQVVPLESADAVFAANLSLEHKLHATDALIYAVARKRAVPFVTCDAHFEGLPGVDYHPKTAENTTSPS